MTITFNNNAENADGEEDSTTSQEYTYGSGATLGTSSYVPTVAEGAQKVIFLGWHKSALTIDQVSTTARDYSASTTVDSIIVSLDGNEQNNSLPLHAVWGRQGYTITIYQQKIENGRAVAGQYEVVSSTLITKDVKVNEVATVTIPVETGFVYHGVKFGSLSEPTKTPVGVDGSPYVAGTSETQLCQVVKEDGSTHFEIYFIRESYAVTYDSNDGIGTDPETPIYYGENVKTIFKSISNPYTKSGYTFAGWVIDGSVAERIANIT